MARRAETRLQVPVAKLRRTCSPGEFSFKTTATVTPLEGTVGQDRAVAAMTFGLDIEAEGFHVFVSGPPGTGRSTELRTQVERIARTRSVPRDWCYVFNFVDPARPEAISLPAGRGNEFCREIDEFVAGVRRQVPQAFESDEYAQRREAIMHEVLERREQFFAALSKEATDRGLAVNATPMGISTVPVVDGKPITKEQYDALTDEQRKQVQQKTSELDSIIGQLAPQLRRLDREVAQSLRAADREMMSLLTAPLLEELKRDFGDEPEAVRFVERMGADMVENLDVFRATEEEQQKLPGGGTTSAMDGVFNRYKANAVVTHDPGATGAPAIFEDNPTYYQLFGRIDYRPTFGAMVTDHTMIRPGSLHRANGGFLMLQALDALSQPLVWQTLKRALRSQQARIENLGEQLTMLPTATMTPEPIPLDVKVALIGTPGLFNALQATDEDFRKLFKARADFTTEVERVPEHVQTFAQFIARQCQMLGMRPFERAAVARMIEHSSRMAANQDKLTLRMMEVVDILVEADYWTCDAGAPAVTAAFVDHAVEQKIYRSRLVEDRLQEFIANGVIKVDVAGEIVGQVNGLSVFDLGDYAFGRPSRITARVSLGRGQVVNIEREVQKSGPSHSKGFLILNGYINGKFAHRQPLSFAASITFEQVHEEVDGDSASSTELYALLSAITDIPLKQGIAVTGAVNQLGEVQAIGGVNEKIEGFFAVCKARGLTGEQGVMIPADNVRNLMLHPDVVDAVRAGRFNIWAVSHVEQGIELLTGMPAGKLRKDGSYADGTVFRKVTDALEAMTKRAIEVNRGPQRDGAVAPTSATPDDRRAREKRKGKARRAHAR